MVNVEGVGWMRMEVLVVQLTINALVNNLDQLQARATCAIYQERDRTEREYGAYHHLVCYNSNHYVIPNLYGVP